MQTDKLNKKNNLSEFKGMIFRLDIDKGIEVFVDASFAGE